MRRFLAALIGLSLTACAPTPPTPTFVIQASGASLVVQVGGGYGVRYVRPGAWETARAVLRSPGGQEAAAEALSARDPVTGARRAALTFSGLAPGPDYTLTLTLLRREGEALVTVGEATVEAVTLGAGANAVTIAPGQIRPALQASPPEALRGFVSSVPGAGMIARLNAPGGVVAAPDGTVYVADTENGSIRRVATDAQGRMTVTHLAGIGYSGGYADGEGAGARLNRPNGLAIDSDGAILVADTGNARIRRIVTGTDGRIAVSTVRNATGGSLTFASLNSLGVEPAGTYVVGQPTQLLRLSPSGQGYAATPLAGDAASGFADGAGTAARFGRISDLAVAPDGTIYVADAGNDRVRVVSPAGVVSSLPGSYPGVSALALAQGQLYMAEPTRFSRLNLATGVVAPLAGGAWPGFADGPGATAAFAVISGLAVTPGGTIFIVDAGDHRLRRAEPQPDGGLFVGTVVGDGVSGNTNGPAVSRPLLTRATSAVVDPRGGVLVADAEGHRIVRIAPGPLGDYDFEVLAGTGQAGSADGPGPSAGFNGPAGLAIAPSGEIYVTDVGNGRLRRLTRGEDGAVTVSTVVSGLEYPGGVAVAEDGKVFVTEAGLPSSNPFFAAFGQHRILEVTLDEAGAGKATVIAGGSSGFADGPGAQARFFRPTSIALAGGGALLVADAENHRIRRLTPSPEGGYAVTTLAGTGVAGNTNGPVATARFNRPAGLALDAAGRLYVADYWNHRIQVIEDGEVRTVTGGLGDGYVDGPVNQALFSRPVAVALGPDGMLYVVDAHPHGVRRVSP